MPKKLIKRLFPQMHEVREHSHLKFLGTLIHKENLWHINRNSIANAVAIGLFCAFIPIPFQMILAALLAILIGANIPASVLLVWISNPLTITPIFYLCYKVGQWILQTPITEFSDSNGIDRLLEIEHLWQFLLGCFIMSCVSAALGYSLVKVVWRLHIISYLKHRNTRNKYSADNYQNK